MTLVDFLQKNKLTRKLVYEGGISRANIMVKEIEPYLRKQDKILDVGPGVCAIAKVLQDKGYDMTLLDVENLSFVDNMEPIIYDGTNMPFVNDTFDVSLILTTLHHTPSPEKILEESKRVSNRIIIIEDLYDNTMQKHISYFLDSLLNLEFKGHPHSNKTDKEWKETFNNLGLKLRDAQYKRFYGVFKSGTYYLEK